MNVFPDLSGLSLRSRTHSAFLLGVCVLSLFGCDGDTLYDKGGPTGPTPQLSEHQIAVETDVPDRLEATDSFLVKVAAKSANNRPIARIGVTTIFLHPGSDSSVVVRALDITPPVAGIVEHSFWIPVADIAAAGLSQEVEVETHGFAIDTEGACVAASSATPESFPCAELSADVFTSGSINRVSSSFVEGRSFSLPKAGRIADLLPVSTASSPRLVLSNQTAHELQVLDLDTHTWQNVRVGSEPWGLGTTIEGDTLMVANSGGTNISYVPFSTMQEDLSRRLATPNAVLFEIHITQDSLGFERYSGSFYDFSDRPQFLAQDANRHIIYSTKPTEAAAIGSVRIAEYRSGWARPEVRFLFTGRAVKENTSTWAIAHLDSLRIFANPGSDDVVVLFDHVPGFPSQRIASAPAVLENALAEIRSLGSDAVALPGNWDLEEVGLSDTTFVAASGNRTRIAVGEGARGPAGRIFLWDAPSMGFSNEISVADLVDNASERIIGLSLSEDGGLGLARGEKAAYFFNPELRLQGLYGSDLKGGRGGATLRGTSPEYAFVASGDRSILVIEPVHYQVLSEIKVQETLVGALKVGPALPSDNEGIACPISDLCVVQRLYGMNTKGEVVIIPVRSRYLSR